MGSEGLPEPRGDGMCCVCREKMAETRDGRFCRGCLRRHVAGLTPMVGCYPRERGVEKRENTYETKHGRD